MAPVKDRKIFHFVMIKPSHYDDDGYVIQWAKSQIPSNSLAALYGLALDCAERHVLGENVEIRLSAYDETNTRIKVANIARDITRDGGHGLVGMVGVQTNQFPRAMDMARQFLAHGVQVCIGGFHVSGCLAMLPDVPADLQEAMDLGISLFAGEAEGRLASLLQEAYRNDLKPVYNYMDDLPSIEDMPVPFLPADRVRRAGNQTSFDAGRGCPYLCSFCTIINVQGRKSRFHIVGAAETGRPSLNVDDGAEAAQIRAAAPCIEGGYPSAGSLDPVHRQIRYRLLLQPGQIVHEVVDRLHLSPIGILEQRLQAALGLTREQRYP